MYLSRKEPPTTRESITKKERVGSLKFYVTVGFYDDDPLVPCEIFVNVAKEGSTLGGLCTQIAVTMSLALQHNTPWEVLSVHLRHSNFAPCGPSLDGTRHYSSIASAIVHCVDDILAVRAAEFGRRTLNEPPSEEPPRSPPEPSPESSDQPPDPDGSD